MNQHYQIVFKSCQTFAKNYFRKFNFDQNWNFLFVLKVKTQLSLSQNNFLVLIVKNWNPRKWPTLMLST